MTAPRIVREGYDPTAHAAYDGSIAVPLYSLMYYDGNDVKPASSQADQLTETKNQALFAKNFAGLSAEAKDATAAADDHFPLLVDVIGDFDCASATFEVGDRVAACEASSGTALENLKLKKTTSDALAIGVVQRREASATTTVRVRLQSNVHRRVNRNAPLVDGTANVETLAGTKTLVVTDASVQVLDPGGAGRNVVLPSEAGSAGKTFTIHNAADAAEVLTVKASDGTTTVVTPTQGETAIVFCDGTTWRGIVGANV